MGKAKGRLSAFVRPFSGKVRSISPHSHTHNTWALATAATIEKTKLAFASLLAFSQSCRHRRRRRRRRRPTRRRSRRRPKRRKEGERRRKVKGFLRELFFPCTTFRLSVELRACSDRPIRMKAPLLSNFGVGRKKKERRRERKATSLSFFPLLSLDLPFSRFGFLIRLS